MNPVGSRRVVITAASAAVVALACGGSGVTSSGARGDAGPYSGGATSSDGGATSAGGASPGGGNGAGGAAANGGANPGSGGSPGAGGASAGSGGSGGSVGAGGASAGSGGSGGAGGGTNAGWLFTKGGKIYVSDGTGGPGTPWMGRGVNIDDIFLCGYDNSLWMTKPEDALKTIISGLVSGWKPNFIRISLAMASNQTVTSFVSNAAQYKTPMTNVINAIGAHPNVYALVTVRSDASMILQDDVHGDPEATGIPSDAKTTPDPTKFPTGTDATYVALVDAFAQSSFVMFGLTNEPGGSLQTDATIAAAMSHAVGTIRAEEDRLGVPHHIVSVQGNNWTSKIDFYATTPIAQDNVVYELHGYPPDPSAYTFANIPVIIGEYGNLTSGTAPAFFADVESKQIPNLAWDFDPYSNCAPDLVDVTTDASKLTPTPWGSIVQSYLLAHAH